MVFTTEGFLKIVTEKLTEWDINPQQLDSIKP